MNEQSIPDLNIFMVCKKLNKEALSELPEGFYIRNCRPDELDIWKGFPFDNDEDKKEYYGFMTEYFNNVYGNNLSEFFNRCLFVCDKNDRPVSTCFIWKAYDKINTIHWFKTLKEYEGKGLGRALLSYIMSQLNEDDYPVYLHTQPSSFRAIGLYSSFGFKIITNEKIGNRENNYKESLEYLERFMLPKNYGNLEFEEVSSELNEAAKSSSYSHF